MVAVLLGLPGISPGAVTEVVPQFSQRLWLRSDGLPSNEITALCLDRPGYLWIATAAGLVRFDGSRFLTFGFAPGGHLARTNFAALVADLPNDCLWAAPAAGGLIRYQHGAFETFPLPGAYAGRRIARLLVAADGALWICFEGGEVMRLHEGKHEVFGAGDGMGPQRSTQIANDGKGRVWLGNSLTLAWYEAGKLHHLPLPDITDNIRIATARRDGPWVLTRGWIYKVVDGRLTDKTQVNANFNAYSVQAMLEDSAGAIWTATRAHGVRRLTLPEVQSDLAISNPEDIGLLLEDRTGSVWAGSNGGGLVRVQSGMVRRFDKSQGLLESHTLSVCQDNVGTIWLANRDGGVAFVNDQGRVHTLSPPRSRGTFTVRSVAPWGESGVLVAAANVLLRADQSGLLPIEAPNSPPQPPPHGQLRVTHVARNGDLWMALEPGRLGRLHEGKWDVFTEAEGLVFSAISAIAEDAEGNLWLATESAEVLKFDGTRFGIVPLALPPDVGSFQALHFDATGHGWIGSSQAGLLRMTPGPVRNLGTEHGLPSGSISQVITDDQGTMWLGSPDGIFHVRQEALEKFFAGTLKRVDTVVLGSDEGLLEISCAQAHQPSVWKSREGLLLFATRQGLIAINPQKEKSVTTPLVVEIDGVRADGAVVREEQGVVRIPSGTRTVELDYSVLCLAAPERVRARVRLEGYDDGWTPTSERGLARYSRLLPGDYTFFVEARLAGTPSTTTVREIHLVVVAAWWQRLWVRGAAVLGFLLVGALAIRTWSHRRLQARVAQLEHASALERERARIAQNIHDDLGSGLTRISLLTQSTDPGEGRQQLERIYRVVSGLTQAMDEIVWAVNPKNDNLENFANYLAEFAQGFLTDAEIRCRVLLPERLPAVSLAAQFRHHLFLGCKEALNNAVKHARASEVTVQVRVEDERLLVAISDNGCGMQEAAPRQDTNRLGPPNGLTNMRARLAALGGTCEITSSPSGTVVTFTAPFRSHLPVA